LRVFHQSKQVAAYHHSFTASFSGSGGIGSSGVTADESCSWTAVSNDSWISITSGGRGTGNGKVSYSVSPNLENGPRTGSLTVAGQTFAAIQSAAPTATPTPRPRPTPRLSLEDHINLRSRIFAGERPGVRSKRWAHSLKRANLRRKWSTTIS